jgi:hypothetical protein
MVTVITIRITMAVGVGTVAGDMAGIIGIRITMVAGATVGITGTSGNPEKGASAPFFFCRMRPARFCWHVFLAVILLGVDARHKAVHDSERNDRFSRRMLPSLLLLPK